MNKPNNDIIYTATDIEKYFSGKLSATQMHAMERAALDDDLLAEAMEGYEALEKKEWDAQLTKLHRHFAERISTAKVIPMKQGGYRWWKAAAAILVIGSGAALTYVLTTEKKTEPGKQAIAQTIIKATDSANPQIVPSSPTSVSTISDKKENQSVVAVPVGRNEQANNGLITDKGSVMQKDSLFVYKPSTTQQVSTIKSDVAIVTDQLEKNKPEVNPASPVLNNNTVANNGRSNTKIEETNTGIPGYTDLAQKKVNQSAAPVLKGQILNRSFAAQIVGPDNTPLPFSNISIKSENFGTYADVRGNFRLVSSDSLLNVEVRSVGYLPRTITMRSNQSQQRIVLDEEDIPVKEKSVVMNSKDRAKYVSRRATLIKDSVVNVEPSDGWDNYNTYVANNIELPDEIIKNNEHGEIGISFEVRSNGSISNVKIDPSRCNNCEELAKRLIEQGPQWKIKKGSKGTARIKVKF